MQNYLLTTFNFPQKITSPAVSSSNLNEDLLKIAQWAYHWNMSFNPDITNQAQDIIFSRKKNDSSHPRLYFNSAQIQQQSIQKHLVSF